MNVTFYYDIVCPYAYLASTQLERLAECTGASVEWAPVLLGGIFRNIGGQQSPMNAMSAPRAKLNLLDLQRCADRWGVPFKFPNGHPRRSVEAMRLLTALEGADRVAMSRRLYRAYWCEGLDISDRRVLDELTREMGQNPGLVDDAQARSGLFERTEEATDAGAFGVPAFVVNETLWWGQDRLHLVARALGGEMRPPTIEEPVVGRPSRVRFFHDFSSPFSYLASTQIERVVGAYGVQVEWRPILLGALFREIGTADVPLLEMSAPKRAYMARDLQDWADFWGVEFRFPDHFPLRTVAPLRAALVNPELTHALYAAAWRDNRPIDDPSVLRDVISEAGGDPDEIQAAIQMSDVKRALKDNTALAQQVGACGVPTFQVLWDDENDDSILLWGQDRLRVLEDVLRGWRPSCG